MSDTDPSIKAVQQFEERVVEKGPAWLIKEAHKFVEKLVTSQSLEYPEPSCRFVSDLEKDIIGPKVKEHLIKADVEKMKEKINEERLHGRLLQASWKDRALSQRGCFAWLRDLT